MTQEPDLIARGNGNYRYNRQAECSLVPCLFRAPSRHINIAELYFRSTKFVLVARVEEPYVRVDC